ncbi:MAG: hypothetical protein ACX94B_13030 [Henriciella sp.]
MPKFRKKPVEIEAMRWPGNPNAGHHLVLDWMGRKSIKHMPDGCWLRRVEASSGAVEFNLVIKTLEGEMDARPGDWIIRGVRGEFYPCKPDIFEATYEPCQ